MDRKLSQRARLIMVALETMNLSQHLVYEMLRATDEDVAKTSENHEPSPMTHRLFSDDFDHMLFEITNLARRNKHMIVDSMNDPKDSNRIIKNMTSIVRPYLEKAEDPMEIAQVINSVVEVATCLLGKKTVGEILQ